MLCNSLVTRRNHHDEIPRDENPLRQNRRENSPATYHISIGVFSWEFHILIFFVLELLIFEFENLKTFIAIENKLHPPFSYVRLSNKLGFPEKSIGFTGKNFDVFNEINASKIHKIPQNSLINSL